MVLENFSVIQLQHRNHLLIRFSELYTLKIRKLTAENKYEFRIIPELNYSQHQKMWFQ